MNASTSEIQNSISAGTGYTFGRKGSGVWHRVSTDSTHRPTCNQRLSCPTVSKTQPAGRLCGKCFPAAPAPAETPAAADTVKGATVEISDRQAGVLLSRAGIVKVATRTYRTPAGIKDFTPAEAIEAAVRVITGVLADEPTPVPAAPEPIERGDVELASFDGIHLRRNSRA